MALTIKHVEQADGRIQKKFGKSVQRAEAQFHFVDVDEVRKEYAKIYPKNSSPDAFVDPRSRPYHVWIPFNHKDESLLTHEVVHLYGMWYTPTFPDQYKVNINEGVTEYFTRQVAAERRDSYAGQHAEIAALVKFLGSEEPLRQAFFQGCFALLQGAAGLLTFARWSAQMAAGEWSAARKILSKPPDKPRTMECRGHAAGH